LALTIDVGWGVWAGSGANKPGNVSQEKKGAGLPKVVRRIGAKHRSRKRGGRELKVAAGNNTKIWSTDAKRGRKAKPSRAGSMGGRCGGKGDELGGKINGTKTGTR